MAMASLWRTFLSPYYCELCNRILIPSANLEEQRAKAIHPGLLEASMKMTRHQLQVFRKDLKVHHRKQNLSAKLVILEVLQKLVEPKNWCVHFSKLFTGFFFVRLFSLLKWFGPWSKLHQLIFFPLCVATPAWNKSYIFERKRLISLVLWKMSLGLVVRWYKSWGCTSRFTTSVYDCFSVENDILQLFC